MMFAVGDTVRVTGEVAGYGKDLIGRVGTIHAMLTTGEDYVVNGIDPNDSNGWLYVHESALELFTSPVFNCTYARTGKIGAIKALRELVPDMGLKDAKDAIEAIMASVATVNTQLEQRRINLEYDNVELHRKINMLAELLTADQLREYIKGA